MNDDGVMDRVNRSGNGSVNRVSSSTIVQLTASKEKWQAFNNTALEEKMEDGLAY